jgi:SNF2 family DNA or RNA helicase
MLYTLSIERRKNFMNYKFKTKPYAHQLKALEMSWDRPYFAYFMEMGTGKSKVLIDNISMLYDNGKINGVLIVAPKGVVKNWYEGEVPTHIVKHIDYKCVLWQSLINAKQQKKLDTLFEAGEDLHVLVMNVEALSTKKGVAFAEKFLNSHRAMMAIDESTTIKNPNAKRTKNIVGIGKLATYRRILTGSPVTKSPLDLYKQCEFLEDELLGFNSYYAFRTRYAVMRTANFSGRSVQIVVGYRNLDELSEKLKAFSYRVLKDECLDLPKKTFMKREVMLTEEQTKAYLQMQKLAHAQLDGKMMTTATVLTQLMRLQQITCGHFTADDGTIHEMPNNRIGELLDLLYEIEGKVVIWAQFQRDVSNILTALHNEFGEGCYVDYYGLTPQEDRQENIKKFQDPDSGVRFFVGTTQTGGYGITLTAASTMIYYSNGYDLEKRQQSEARIDRIGQEKPMTYIDIICENTVDTRIVKALRKKVDIATQIMGEELKAWI